MGEVSQRNIKHVIAVASGKGGVGKSSVTGLAAVTLARMGYKVGIMDADITGPSIPKIFGLAGSPVMSGEHLLPIETKLGIKVMSLNLLLSNNDHPVIWRGPLISNAVLQFWNEVAWGDLDYLLVDLPPGTGNVPLTVMKSMPLNGVIMVSSPQDLAGMVVGKAINMANALQIRILGLVENMSFLVCPKCGTKMEIFGPSRGEELSKRYSLRFLGKLPLDPCLVSLSDQGKIEEYSGLEIFRAIPDAVEERAK